MILLFTMELGTLGLGTLHSHKEWFKRHQCLQLWQKKETRHPVSILMLNAPCGRLKEASFNAIGRLKNVFRMSVECCVVSVTAF